ncbi:MAG: DUF3570 domain-containing protein [Opitutaceae bacterium]
MKFASLKHPRIASLAALLACLAPRAGRAENAVAYKYEDYHEFGGRIEVQTHAAHFEQDLGTALHLKLDGIIDAIAGATPSGVPAPSGNDKVVLSQLRPERRKAWNASLARQFSRTRLDLGAANSRESDYVSNGWSFNTLTDFNQKNTTLLAGVAGTSDRVKVLDFEVSTDGRKRTNDVIVGVTQLLDPRTAMTFNLTWGRARGYLTDPYKLVKKTTELLPGLFLPLTPHENRPAEREKWIALVALNRSFPEARGTIDASYRFYHDTFGTDAHTVDLAWFQNLGRRFMLRPSFRFYDQSAANFYYYTIEGTPIVPIKGPIRTQGPFYSSDFRLSAFRSYTSGLKAIWNATDALQFDAALERYEMRGRDGVTPQSAYCAARIVTVGARFSW